ncbi:DMT family transporter [Methylococcus sp. EFPC2]|uniref:DMT family transporter n=1 Tax=Methylococcus sp. EFPC2 TaxID=2812648 RepID=UPI0019687064|nr:DMT family transporter [Methylococcus sp. EFPC2]QSA98801.1 DMT family transporter [Methylococcus sp. EFPC2]
MYQHIVSIGPGAALAAAFLFGLSVPAAKWLLADVGPWGLAGWLYAGSGLGLTFYRWARRLPATFPEGREWLSLGASTVLGGMVAPVLLMVGLSGQGAASASLLLNAEGVFTTLLAWFWFRENFDTRIAIGMVAIVAGAAVLGVREGGELALSSGAAAVLGACLCWAVDNNVTRKVAHLDAVWLASVKGLVAGAANLGLSAYLGEGWPAWVPAMEALLLGWLSYGVSLTLFVVGLRHLGTARTSAYFSQAPLFGALCSVLLLGEPVDSRLIAAAALMGLGVWLHLTERHSHEHTHDAIEHDHVHVHDEHHQHEHDEPAPPGTRHRHRHRHEPLRHSHPHFPDIHHRHGHRR